MVSIDKLLDLWQLNEEVFIVLQRVKPAVIQRRKATDLCGSIKIAGLPFAEDNPALLLCISDLFVLHYVQHAGKEALSKNRGIMMQKQYGKSLLLSAVITILLMLQSVVSAADRVVVITLGGEVAVGNATAADVVKGKSFSSKAAGKGVTGTLVLPPCAQSYTNSNGMTFNLIPAGIFTMGSPADETRSKFL